MFADMNISLTEGIKYVHDMKTYILGIKYVHLCHLNAFKI